MSIDPDGKRLQIDDLIIIPNTLQQVSSGGSALQNLAKIAKSIPGYQRRANLAMLASPRPHPPVQSYGERVERTDNRRQSRSRECRLIRRAMRQRPKWPCKQQLLSMFSPMPGSSGTKGTPSPMELAAAMAMMGIPPLSGNSDPSKMGPEGVNFLQLYEKQLNPDGRPNGCRYRKQFWFFKK